ncbi:MAG: helix-turn-helix domain-containing protein [Acutalibacteraceae bacterium]
MVAAYKAGESVTSLSRNYSLSRTAIYFWIKSFV